LVVQRARALHEGRNYFPSSRFNIDRYISESAHYLCSSRGTAPVREREILRPADVRAEHLLAVDEHDERMPGLHSARIETDREVLEREPILPVGGERIDEAGAAAAAEGHAVDVGALILVRRRNIGRRNLGLRLADGKMRGRARQIEVLLDECRRRAERGGDVREAVDLDLRRQILRRVDLDAEEILDGFRELRAVEALGRNVADPAILGALVDRVLEPPYQRIDVGLLGLTGARRRHQTAAQLRDRTLENLGVLGHGLRSQTLEAEVSGAIERVVAIGAVGLEQSPPLLLAEAVTRENKNRCDGSDGSSSREPSPGSSHHAHLSSTRKLLRPRSISVSEYYIPTRDRRHNPSPFRCGSLPVGGGPPRRP